MIPLLALLLVFAGCSGGGGAPDESSSPTVQEPAPPTPAPTPTPAPIPSTMVTWRFQGHLVDGGVVEGSVTYDHALPAYVANLNSLEGNAGYHLASWELHVTQTVEQPATVTFSSVDPLQSGYLCLGRCLFSPTQFQQVYLTNGLQTLSLLWMTPERTTPPIAASDWGNFEPESATFKWFSPGGLLLWLWPMTDGALLSL